ncbi:MAG TPA: hypothetical protein VKT82_24670 [Ktedonobacterales bacterium]|nr:hypothetical protein [Ktedonobacterales bacterium]
MLDLLLLAGLVVVGTAALWLAAMACYHGGAALEWLIERLVYGREQE